MTAIEIPQVYRNVDWPHIQAPEGIKGTDSDCDRAPIEIPHLDHILIRLMYPRHYSHVAPLGLWWKEV